MKKQILAGATALAIVPGLMVVASPAPAASPQSNSETRASANVTIKLRVKNCSKCVVEVDAPYYNHAEGYPDTLYFKRVRLNKKGNANFTVSRSIANKLTYMLPAQKKFKKQGFATGIAFQYSGIKAGKKVSAKKAAQKKRGYYCFSVPNRNSITVKVRVQTFKHKWNGKTRTMARAWASPSFKGKGERAGGPKGVLQLYHSSICGK